MALYGLFCVMILQNVFLFYGNKHESMPVNNKRFSSWRTVSYKFSRIQFWLVAFQSLEMNTYILIVLL